MKGRKDVNKTVKHCRVCQENFGDRFSFCPVCGEPLKAVEVGQNEAFAAAPTRDNARLQSEEVASTFSAPVLAENAPQFVRQSTNESANGANKFQTNPPEKIIEKAVEDKPQFVTTDMPRPQTRKVTAGDGMYHLTMLQTPPTYRRYLSYGAIFGMFLLLTSGIAFMIVGIYSYNLDLEAPEAAMFLSNVVIDDVPFKEEKETPRKNNDKGGGGGGGGNNESKPASKGGNPAQAPEPPVFKPSTHIPQLENPALAVTPTVQTPNRTKRDEGPIGIKSSLSTDPSDGPGRNGGIGTGNNGGVGSGLNSGIGSGKNGGIGSGEDGGIGTGKGPGQNGNDAPPAPKAAVTEKLNIISKPRANYTEEARKNQISGTVRLRVTFSASGQVTGVTAVSGLPYGLTEQAIAAARQIKFTPEKRGGQAISKMSTIEYNFNLY